MLCRTVAFTWSDVAISNLKGRGGLVWDTPLRIKDHKLFH